VSAFSVRQALNDQENENELLTIEGGDKFFIKTSTPKPVDSESSLDDLVSNIST